MWGPPGHAYVYLCYGIHHLFNVVTSVAGDPQAVLVRGGSALDGVDTILKRRVRNSIDDRLLVGPGSLAQGLGIRTDLSGESLLGDRIWIEDHAIIIRDNEIITGPRVGVDYAGEDAERPYRFRVS